MIKHPYGNANSHIYVLYSLLIYNLIIKSMLWFNISYITCGMVKVLVLLLFIYCLLLLPLLIGILYW